jgi:hypothetical protein
MPKEVLEIDKIEGESAAIAKEDMPGYIVQKLENKRPAVKLGSAVSRDPYTNKITSGITTLQNMKEFTDANGDSRLVLIDNNTIRASVNSSGTYAATALITNDNRTSGSTVYGSQTHPITFNNEIRSGAGLNASTDRPFWLGYIEERARYTDVTVAAGEYLENQIIKDSLVSTMFSDPTGQIGVGSNTNSLGGWDKDDGDKAYIMISPLIDDYQRGFPEIYWPFDDEDALMNVLYDNTNIQLTFIISAANASKLTRVTGFDIFVIQTWGSVKSHKTSNTGVGYWVGRIKFDEDGDYFLNKTATLDHTAGTITIASASDWHTFPLNEVWCYDATNDKTYLIDTDTDSSGSRELTVRAEGDSLTDDGSADLHFYFGWFKSTNYYYSYKIDNHYINSGSEMYDYLNIPRTDEGLDDNRFKYLSWNGSRALYSGKPDEEKVFSYYTPPFSPDIVPSLNIIRHKAGTRGNTNIGEDFLVFTDKGTERISIVDNTNAYQDSEYLNIILTSQKGIVKIDDNTIALMSFQGPYLISGREARPLGDFGHLRQWWTETFTQAQMEACVAGYNFKEEEIWFSFPTYTTSPYTTGIIFVFDLKAYRANYVSAWWRIKTDIAVVAFDMNTQFNLIGGTTTGTDKVVDFNTAGTDEDVQWKIKLKVIENPLLSKKVRFDRLYVDFTSDDTVVGDCYFDDSETSGLSLTFDDDETSFIRYIAKKLEVEIYNETASTNSSEVKRILLTYKPLRK